MDAAATAVSQVDGNSVAASLPTLNLVCNVCFKILKFLAMPFGERREMEMGKVADLLAYDCPHSDWIRNLQYMNRNVPRYEDRHLGLHKWDGSRGASFGVRYMTKNTSFLSTTDEFAWVFRPEVPQHPGTARILDPGWIDLDLVRDWRSQCIGDHGNECERSVIPGLEPFHPEWLIDVNQTCIVPCEGQGSRFLTLSYTWGQTESFRTTRSTLEEARKPGAFQSGRFASQIPETIGHVIELTKALGESRLWVDALCVVQDDEAALAHHLRNMHLIYATSFLTIVARDGRDASYGLRGLQGISPPRATLQNVVSLAGGEKVATGVRRKGRSNPPHPRDYDQRMWTFQERVFAKRRLVFSNGDISWQCNCAAWSEHSIYHPQADSILCKDFRDAIPEGLLSRVPSLTYFGVLIRDFNNTNLSFDEDVFDAFAGIHTYLNSIFPSGLVFGLPELFFEIALCWHPTSRYDLRRRKASGRRASDAVHARLPSWSWMGWQGPTYFPFDLEYGSGPPADHGFTESVTQWYAVESPTSTSKRPIASAWSRCRKTTPQAIPDGWTCAEFTPPEEYDQSEKQPFIPHSMPKELPTHIYRHASQEDTHWNYNWYPVPVVDDSYSTKTQDHEPHRRFHYLRCETSRAYLFGSPEKSFYLFTDHIHLIHDSQGHVVGGLQLHHRDDGQLFETGPKRIELIAVAKGWSTQLSYSKERPESPGAKSPRTEDVLTEEEAREELKKQHWSSQKSPWMEVWEGAKASKQDCYHVLWIEWQDNIAYRKGSGFVLADKWEQYAEPEKVDIILE